MLHEEYDQIRQVWLSLGQFRPIRIILGKSGLRIATRCPWVSQMTNIKRKNLVTDRSMNGLTYQMTNKWTEVFIEMEGYT